MSVRAGGRDIARGTSFMHGTGAPWALLHCSLCGWGALTSNILFDRQVTFSTDAIWQVLLTPYIVTLMHKQGLSIKYTSRPCTRDNSSS